VGFYPRRMCCTACHIDAPRRRRCSTYLSDHPGTNTRPCLVDSSETNWILLIGVKQKKKIIIINNKKIYTYFIPHVLYVRGSDVETRNHDENIVISLYNLTIFSPPLLVQHIWRSETSRIWKYYTYAWVSGIAAHHSCILTR